MDIDIKNAVIESATLGIGDRGFLDAWVMLDYGGCGQGFGGYTLHLPKSWKPHSLQGIAGHHIFRILEISGAEEWSKLKGKTIRVRTENGLIKGIGHIVKDDWFIPSEDYKEIK